MKELAKMEKRQAKAAKRAARKEDKDSSDSGGFGDVDPDLAGMVAGPQPKPEWAQDEEDVEV